MSAFFHDAENEFFKLDELDRLLFFEILENHEKAVFPWIDHVCVDYKRKGVDVDAEKFKSEVRKLQGFLKNDSR